jgi:hypothetical protein
LFSSFNINAFLWKSRVRKSAIRRQPHPTLPGPPMHDKTPLSGIPARRNPLDATQ